MTSPPGAMELEALRIPLPGYCYRMLGGSSETEDAVQETLLRAFREIGTFDPARARLTTWAHRIAHNVCVDLLRAAGRRASPMDIGNLGEPGVFGGARGAGHLCGTHAGLAPDRGDRPVRQPRCTRTANHALARRFRTHRRPDLSQRRRGPTQRPARAGATYTVHAADQPATCRPGSPRRRRRRRRPRDPDIPRGRPDGGSRPVRSAVECRWGCSGPRCPRRRSRPGA